jgi:hypothetical protein
VLLKHTLTVAAANHAIKSADTWSTINQRSLAIGCLPRALGAAIPLLMPTTIVVVAVATMQSRNGFEFTIPPILRRLGTQLTILRIDLNSRLNGHRHRVQATGTRIRILVSLIPGEFILKKRTIQLTIKRRKADRLASLCALFLIVAIETR